MNIIDAVILGIIEGLTEFLPVSSTGHLTIAEKLLGYHINEAGITAFTAIIQIGAIAATLVYFRKDIVAIVRGWLTGLTNQHSRGAEYRMGWAIIIGSMPIIIIGYVFKDHIETNLRSLWLVAVALIVWSGVMFAADRLGRQARRESDTTWRDTLIIGLVQCIALIPGISRSGATISAGLLRGFDRVAVTRLSFFLAIPALSAAGLYELLTKGGDISSSVGWTATIVGTIVSFFIAYGAIAWLLKFVAKHNFNLFIAYRLALGCLLIVLLASGAVGAN